MSEILDILKNDDSNQLQKIIEDSNSLDLLYEIENLHKFIPPKIPLKNLTLLHAAAYYNSLNCYILLLKQEKFNTRTLNPDSYYPFHYACYNHSYEVFNYTLQIDPLIVQSCPEGAEHQYLYLSSYGNDHRIIKKLFEYKINIKLEKETIECIIDEFINEHAPLRSIQFLLDNTIHTNIINENIILQMSALINNSPYLLPYLIKSPEDASFISPEGESVFSLACFYGLKTEILDMLKINGNKQIEPPISIQCKGVCHWICQLADYDVAKAMLSTPGVLINRLDNRGYPGIFHLLDQKKSNDEITKIMLLLIENVF